MIEDEEVGPPHWPDYPAWKRWTEGKCEHLRLEYPLNKDSVVLDLGAYHAGWSTQISDLYDYPTIYAFEPVDNIRAVAIHDIINYPNIKLFNYGLGKTNEYVNISDSNESSSLYLTECPQIRIEIKSVKDVFQSLNLKHVDLMKINIEGAEYDVLECMLENDLHIKVKDIQIQFHRLGENYLERHDNIRAKLKETHKLTYEYKFIWENWTRK